MRIVLLRMSLRADRVVLDLAAVDEAGRHAVGDPAKRQEQGEQGDEHGRGRPTRKDAGQGRSLLDEVGFRPRTP